MSRLTKAIHTLQGEVQQDVDASNDYEVRVEGGGEGGGRCRGVGIRRGNGAWMWQDKVQGWAKGEGDCS